MGSTTSGDSEFSPFPNMCFFPFPRFLFKNSPTKGLRKKHRGLEVLGFLKVNRRGVNGVNRFFMGT